MMKITMNITTSNGGLLNDGRDLKCSHGFPTTYVADGGSTLCSQGRSPQAPTKPTWPKVADLHSDCLQLLAAKRQGLGGYALTHNT